MNLAAVVLEHGECFGQLTVLERIRKKSGKTMYRVGCTCGNSSNLVRGTLLMRGKVTSCGRCRRAAIGSNSVNTVSELFKEEV